MNWQLKQIADRNIPKVKAAQFDIVKYVSPELITTGLEMAISTGNWVIKRFRMERAGVTQVRNFVSRLDSIYLQARFGFYY